MSRGPRLGLLVQASFLPHPLLPQALLPFLIMKGRHCIFLFKVLLKLSEIISYLFFFCFNPSTKIQLMN